MNTNELNSEIITKLLQLDEEIKLTYNTTLDNYLGIQILRSEGTMYECTPEDAKVFAYTGMGGDHFAFSTQHGMIYDLDQAPVLFVQPMIFDCPVKVVARNIRDFFSLYLSLKEIYILERFDWYKSEKDMFLDIEENYAESIIERSDDINFLSDKLEQYLAIKPIGNAYSYVVRTREDIKC
ncbi:hypothetical protein [Paenibacillus xylanexedens]|uniref:hypothetical protein n=1 Tax=Paenibacillus xylanexedens TaxID=528191 RepID=UPI00119DCA94|nr:hypothetical protein [Paenibacillus xylanexedens]